MIKNVHVTQGDTVMNKQAIAERLISRWRLKGEEAALFRLYTSKPSGFKPNQTYIAENTGILENNISRARDKLAEHKFIIVDGDNIIIDWRVLKGLAMIPDTVKVTGHKAHILPDGYPWGTTVEDKLWHLYRLGAPDVNPMHLTPGCLCHAEEAEKEAKPKWEGGNIPETDANKPVLFEAGVLASYDLPF